MRIAAQGHPKLSLPSLNTQILEKFLLTLVSASVDHDLDRTSQQALVCPYDFGGVLTNSNRDIINGDGIHKRNQLYKEMHCLHPGDLYPFTRKPLFVIVDSSNSVAYKVSLFKSY
ncbi:Protein SCAI, partial [Ophiophagus hannah]